MKTWLSILILLLTQQTISQELIKREISKDDPYSFYINDNDSTNLFYYKMVPNKAPIGALILLPSGGESIESMLNQITLHKEALKNNLLVVIPSYNWGTIQQIPEISFFDTIFEQVVNEHKVSKDNFIFCGLSNGAMIALTYGVRSVRDSNTYIIPKGIIGLDPPVDLSRFYNYCEREIERNFSEAGVNEAKWLKNVYNQVYGGSPDSFPTQYQEASVFSYGSPKGGNAKYLNDIGILMYSDLNIDFLLNQRKRDLYDWNGTDIVAFVNQLQINGNKNAEVIISQNKGKRPDGTLHPHSWSILNTKTTIEWILELLKENKADHNKQTHKYFVNEKLQKSDYIEDLNQLVDSLQTYHPQPYEFISKNDFESFINVTKNKITDSTTVSEFAWISSEVAAKVGCLHTNTSASSILNFSSEMFFPLNVKYVDSKLYLTDTYKPNTELKTHTEIVKINGIDVLELKNKIANHISSDGYNEKFLDEIINRNFGYFCTLQLNFPTGYKLEIKEDNIKKEVLLNKNLNNQTSDNSNTQTKNLEFEINTPENLAVITIKSFVYYDDQLPVFKSFVDSCFKQIKSQQIKNVVIDLRDNGGGDPYCATHLLQYISNKSFRYYKKGSTDAYKDLEKKIKPFKNNFSGKLYILINSLCCSTTGHLCSILKYHNIGTLIGSETGATYSCNANNINFKLKNTGISASVATKTYQTDVTGFKKNRGIIPDYQTTKNLKDTPNKDMEMKQVMELINAK